MLTLIEGTLSPKDGDIIKIGDKNYACVSMNGMLSNCIGCAFHRNKKCTCPVKHILDCNKNYIRLKEQKVISNSTKVQRSNNKEPEMVDLGLSVKWAKYNLGVDPNHLDKAEDWYGGYYAWGELVSGKTDYIYSWNNYQYGNKDNLSKYNSTDGLTTLQTSDDAATVAYGSNFRMPTQAELEELTGLTSEWVEDYQGISGLNGRLFHGTGDYSANTLFIPAAGYCNVVGRFGVAVYGCVWSSSLNEDDSEYAWCLNFNSGRVFTNDYNRFYGYSVRGVSRA